MKSEKQPTATAIDSDPDARNKSIKRDSSIISFKSLDFNLKTIYSSMKSRHGSKEGSSSRNGQHSTSKTSLGRPPYVRVETVDHSESETLLTFSQSPYLHRGSCDRTGSQFLNAQSNAADYTRSQSNSPFLCINTPPNIRRSSTSDIIDKNSSAIPSAAPPTAVPVDNRRPSTSDLLRRARERKGGGDANKMGRSVSQGGLPRGGRGGRRTSMAF